MTLVGILIAVLTSQRADMERSWGWPELSIRWDGVGDALEIVILLGWATCQVGVGCELL